MNKRPAVQRRTLAHALVSIMKLGRAFTYMLGLVIVVDTLERACVILVAPMSPIGGPP